MNWIPQNDWIITREVQNKDEEKVGSIIIPGGARVGMKLLEVVKSPFEEVKTGDTLLVQQQNGLKFRLGSTMEDFYTFVTKGEIMALERK